MAELKTKLNDGDVLEFLNSVEHEQRRKDGLEVLELMQEATGEQPKMWGTSIVGFGSYHYKYKSGQEGDWMEVGFSPRKQSMSLYIMSGFSAYGELLAKLGKHKTGKSCLYINKMEDVDKDILKDLIKRSVAFIRSKDWSAQ